MAETTNNNGVWAFGRQRCRLDPLGNRLWGTAEHARCFLRTAQECTPTEDRAGAGWPIAWGALELEGPVWFLPCWADQASVLLHRLIYWMQTTLRKAALCSRNNAWKSARFWSMSANSSPSTWASPFLKGAVEVVHHRGVHHGRQETCILDAMARRIPSEVVAFRLRPGGWERASKAEKR